MVGSLHKHVLAHLPGQEQGTEMSPAPFLFPALCPGLRRRFFFPCNEWLVGDCERHLVPGQRLLADQACTYKVLVTTSDIRGAGTDADVTMVLYGSKGDTGERVLATSANDFERGKVRGGDA